MRFGSEVAFVFGESWAFARKGWWLAILPPLPRLTYSLLYDSIAPGWIEPAMWASLGLTSALETVLLYGFMRFIALGHDLRAALSIDRAAARTFAPFFITLTALNWAAWMIPILVDHVATWLTVGIVSLIGLPLLALWSATAPSGSTVIGPLRSASLVLPHWLWGIALSVVVAIPVAVLAWASARLLAQMSLDFAAYTAVSVALDLAVSAANYLTLVACLFVIARRTGVRFEPAARAVAAFE